MLRAGQIYIVFHIPFENETEKMPATTNEKQHQDEKQIAFEKVNPI
jgi:hypothetical protein